MTLKSLALSRTSASKRSPCSSTLDATPTPAESSLSAIFASVLGYVFVPALEILTAGSCRGGSPPRIALLANEIGPTSCACSLPLSIDGGLETGLWLSMSIGLVARSGVGANELIGSSRATGLDGDPCAEAPPETPSFPLASLLFSCRYMSLYATHLLGLKSVTRTRPNIQARNCFRGTLIEVQTNIMQTEDALTFTRASCS